MTGHSVPPRSVYLHVPFCSRRCSYCDFAVQAVSEAPTTDWVDAVISELELLALDRAWQLPLAVDTLYIGGGTPSLLRDDAMELLGGRLRGLLAWHREGVEWTCEANPESFTPEVAAAWRRAGVNRISLGVQTFHTASLRWMGRLHGPDGAIRAMRTARGAGFDNVSVDLIFALPERLERVWADDLDRALELEPDHVSLYGLTAEAAAPLGRWVAEGREQLPGDDRYADEYLVAHERLAAAGFRHYEVSNFARRDLLSRHNLAYWSGDPYIGLGPGAHAFYPPVRRWNMRSWDAYRDTLRRRTLPAEGEEVIGVDEAALEDVWLALRTDRGFPLVTATPNQAQSVEEWSRLGWATLTEGLVQLTPAGWLLLDRLAVEFVHAGALAQCGQASREALPRRVSG